MGIDAAIRRARAAWGRIALATRPFDPAARAALERRWAELPDHVRTPSQLLGRRTAGCEGTHGVFPRCNFACRPCYHSADANRVRIDGDHTVEEVRRQMALFRSRRGPGQYAQLIGGEVSLLAPADHARALEVMREHQRVPMSFTHGDFDYHYLLELAVRPDGSPRFDHLSFAAHFDVGMRGRRGIPRPEREGDLDPYRARFCAMFERLRREHGISSYLAHNMTVTPANIAQVADVVRNCRGMGFRMFSFQPAAFVGDASRWDGPYDAVTIDAVWEEIERGTGGRVPHELIQVGDPRCNRTAWGAFVGDRYVAAFDDGSPHDATARDVFLTAVPDTLALVPRGVAAVRLLRAAVTRPRDVAVAGRWAARFVRRAGGPGALVRGVRPVTFVVHSFMDARDVDEAWGLLRRGERSDDPRVRETQQRLEACAYSMAHPETDELVPACVQHGVLDPAENRVLAQRLPLPSRRVGRATRT